MEELLVSIMVSLLGLVGNIPATQSLLADWSIRDDWHKQGNYYFFRAESEQITKNCQRSPDSKILFPQIIHGIHEIYGDGKLILKSGDPTFHEAAPFYRQTFLNCSEALQYKKLEWRVTSYSKFFARITEPIEIRKSVSKNIFFTATTNASAAGILLILSLLSFIIYYRRVEHRLTFSVAACALCFSSYFIFAENAAFGITMSMLDAHRIADLSLWIGTTCLFYAFYVVGSLSKGAMQIQTLTTTLALGVIALGTSGDIIQLGTILPMPGVLLCGLSIVYVNLLKNEWSTVDSQSFVKVTTALMVIIFGTNDILNIFAIGTNFMLLPFGLVGAIMGLAINVNQNIEKTYVERDHLLETLDAKVNDKTKELQDALNSLKTAQSDLVQSAKLASLGTLSAGIAHEINNSINFVFGAIVPLEKRIHRLIPAEERVMVDKLLNSIKEGTRLTIEIVKSLRNYTGLNQTAFKNFRVKEVFDAVLTILRSKLIGVHVEVDVDPELNLVGNLVGINQVIMNLVTNAIDVLPKENPQLWLGAKLENQNIIFWVTDNGCGIPPENQGRIFDPFFTTKEVGKGTGLGLHIIKKEIERHGGNITLSSEINKGTRFEVRIPQGTEIDLMKQEAA